MGAIRRAAVIGAGTMGSGIASHLANAGVPVVLLDVVPPGSGDRNRVAQDAISRMLESQPPAFMSPEFASLVTPGNIEDHMAWLADVDWIAEAVVERLAVKRAIYAKIDAVRKPEAMVSSNTSTIPLALLTEDMSEGLRDHFCITHFFNPVRYMRLLEVVAGPHTREETIRTLSAFCDERLGKGIVRCKDTPGFLANRVGVFALQAGVVEAARLGLTVEEADAVMGRPMGIPKTGVFGLYDLIGLDLMLDVVKSLVSILPPGDAFHDVAQGIPLIERLVATGYTGNKGKGGFYRSVDREGRRVREAVDLSSGEYRAMTRVTPEAVKRGDTGGLRALAESPDKCGDFAWRVLAQTLSYAASLLPEVADDVAPVDEAMKLGYSWSRGPFEMIDALGVDWFRGRLAVESLPVPDLLGVAAGKSFYRVHRNRVEEIGADGEYRELVREPGVLRLGDLKATRTPLAGNEAASVWDVGEGVACLEFHTKANALGPASMSVLHAAVELAEREFGALLIHGGAPHFSVGFNLEFVLEMARTRRWSELDRGLFDFQMACKAAKYACVPVLGAPAGMALGGGYEVLIHCDRLQTHANTVLGLVETMVGLVPSGGGCKELLWRWQQDIEDPAGAASKVFEIIGQAQTASSPPLAKPLRLFRDQDRFTMNRDRLLPEARAWALQLADAYSPPEPSTLVAAGTAGMDALHDRLKGLRQQGVATAHDMNVGGALARVLCGGDRGSGEVLGEDAMYALEREAFLELAGTPETIARIEHMLETGRPLRN